VLLWEALAGGHPFWRAGLLESAEAIRGGAAPLATVRPDLPRDVAAAVDRALFPNPARRPGAAELARALRHAGPRRRKRKRRPRVAPPSRAGVAAATAPAGLAALAAGGGAAALPFFPHGWPAAIAAVAAALALVRPRLALAPALAVPVLPLGNVALALAVLYAGLAVCWLALFAGEPRWALLPALGPVLGAAGALALLPLVLQPLRSPVRRAAAAVLATALAGLAAALRGTTAALTGEQPPAALGIGGSEDPGAVAAALWQAASGYPQLAFAAGALALASVVLPRVRAGGPWAVAVFGAALVAALLLPAPRAAALPVVVSAWALCTLVLLPPPRDWRARLPALRSGGRPAPVGRGRALPDGS
jgi:hypothetical protein